MRMRFTPCLVAIALVALGVPAVAADPINLLAGGDLSQWTTFIWDNDAQKEDTTTPMSDIWTLEDGVLMCKGQPQGFLRTKAEHENYRLAVDWQWPAGTQRANSGVLVHVTSGFSWRFWPVCIEVQLGMGSAGDLVSLGTTLDVPNAETRKRGNINANLTDDSEKPAGEWNHLEVLCQGNEITVWVNGDLVNHATNVSRSKGWIALQSEGNEVHFRNIMLTPLD